MDLTIQQRQTFLTRDKPILKLILIMLYPLFSVVHSPRRSNINLAGFKSCTVHFIRSRCLSTKDITMKTSAWLTMWAIIKKKNNKTTLNPNREVWNAENLAWKSLHSLKRRENEKLRATSLDLILATLTEGEVTTLHVAWMQCLWQCIKKYGNRAIKKTW